jgi:ketosteroid isomerase-like protein
MPGVEQTIQELDKKRMTAMTKGDTETLKSILADDLTYVHTSTAFDTKQSIIEAIENGRLNYKSMEPNDVKVRIAGDAAVVTGIAAVQVVSSGNPLSFRMRFIDVYANRGGSWQMIAWQSTRFPD